ncbi:MAG: MCP four helix bundle domain-containing protein [Acidobacteria bacterium]|nr:MCP four helix bundle domain-containing protein [Acidobacteriota bacterium]
MKTKLTVGKKLGLSFGAIILLLVILGWSSLSAMSSMEATLSVLGNQSARKMELAGLINTAESDMAAAERGMIMFASNKDSANMEAAARQFQENLAVVKKSAQEFHALATLAETREVLDKTDSDVDQWSAGFSQVSALLRAGNIAEASRISSSKDAQLYDSLGNDADQLSKFQKRVNTADVVRSVAAASNSRTIAILLTLVALVVGAGVLFLVRNINRDLRRLAASLSEGATQLAGAASQISSAGETLAQGASEQAASLEETSASSEEIASMTRRNAENSREAAQRVASTAQSVESANRKMEEMLRSMKEITASSDKISRIIKVIDEIAFQTNILALNAAVEAARAGEAGMGFAVVADEVRNLAQRCADAARNTAELIEESISRSREGGSRITEVSEAIGGITEQSAAVKLLVEEIRTGSDEQARGIEQVAGAVAQMQKVTQSTAASAEESASAGSELASQAESLSRLVEDLNAMVGATETHGTEVRHTSHNLVSAGGSRQKGLGKSGHAAFPLE